MASKGRNITGAIIGSGSVYADGSMVHLNDLSRTELAKAYAQAFQGKDSGFPLNLTNAEFINAIVTGVVPESAHRERGVMTGEPTTKQRNFIRGLGGDPWAPTTKAEAAQMIKRLIDEKEKREGRNEWGVKPKIPTPVYEPPTPSPAPTPTVAPTGDTSKLERLIEDIRNTFMSIADVQNVTLSRLESDLNSLSSTVEGMAQRLDAVEKKEAKVIQISIPDRPTIVVKDRQHEKFDHVLMAVNARLNVMLVGPPGTGKSTIAKKVSEVLDWSFGDISFGPTTPESRLMGFTDANGVVRDTVFEKIWTNGGVFCGDEIDNAHPGIVTVLNTALANGHCTFAGGTVKRHKDFVFVATANTHGTGATRSFVGRNQLDAATLDRFLEIPIDYDEVLEDEIAANIFDGEIARNWVALVRQYRRNAQAHNIMAFFTPRATIDGLTLLRDGMPFEFVKQYRLLKGLSADAINKLERV